MDTERATRAISLVLISSVVVFAGWGAGAYLAGTSTQSHPAGQSYTGAHGGHFFWYGPRYYGPGGRGAGGGVVPPPGRGGQVTPPAPGRGGQASPSVRGGFGSFGRGAGA